MTRPNLIQLHTGTRLGNTLDICARIELSNKTHVIPAANLGLVQGDALSYALAQAQEWAKRQAAAKGATVISITLERKQP